MEWFVILITKDTVLCNSRPSPVTHPSSSILAPPHTLFPPRDCQFLSPSCSPGGPCCWSSKRDEGMTPGPRALPPHPLHLPLLPFWLQQSPFWDRQFSRAGELGAASHFRAELSMNQEGVGATKASQQGQAGGASLQSSSPDG